LTICNRWGGPKTGGPITITRSKVWRPAEKCPVWLMMKDIARHWLSAANFRSRYARLRLSQHFLFLLYLFSSDVWRTVFLLALSQTGLLGRKERRSKVPNAEG